MSGIAGRSLRAVCRSPLAAAVTALLCLSALGLAALGLAWGAPGGRGAILIFGDSLTSGYGVGRGAAFPAVLQTRIDSLGWGFEVVNAGLSGETTAAGLRRIDWVLQRPVDVFVLELGGNDGLRGLPTEHTEKTLQQILDRVKAKHPQAALVIAGMQVPPNLGPQYAADFRALFPRLARANGAVLIPFLLEGVGGVAELMQGDGIHPTEEGHRKVADVVWPYLQPVLASILSVDSPAPDAQGPEPGAE